MSLHVAQASLKHRYWILRERVPRERPVEPSLIHHIAVGYSL